MNNWIVITGSLVDTTKSGGFEFFGPFADEQAALKYRNEARDFFKSIHPNRCDMLFDCVELLPPPKGT